MRRWTFALAFACLVAAQPATSQSPFPTTDRARAEALARRAAERMQTLRAEADRLAAEARSILGDLRRLDLQRQIAAEELKQSARDRATLEADIAALDEEASRLATIEELELPALQQRLVELYKLGRGRYLRMLLSTSDVRHLGHASRTIATMASMDRTRVDTRRQRLEELTVARTSLNERRERLAATEVTAQRAEAAAGRAIRDRNALVRQIDERRDMTAALAGELQTAQQRLQATLKSNTPAAGTILPLRPFRGALEWPMPGSVRQRFGVASAGQVRSNGIEIAAREGVPVHAVHEGSVAFAGPFEGYGTLVILEHDAGNFSLYGDLGDLAVERGGRLDRGSAIGSAGVSPTGAEGLYFELRIDGRPVDPLQWLRRR